MSQFTLREAFSSRAFLVFGKSSGLRRGGSEIGTHAQTSWCVRLERTVLSMPGKVRASRSALRNGFVPAKNRTSGPKGHKGDNVYARDKSPAYPETEFFRSL
jgi:hypothetical protein